MNNEQERLFYALLRENLSAFIFKTFNIISPHDFYKHNWHVDLIAQKLTDVYIGKTKRLVINVPPRYMKSISVSVAFTAFMLGHSPFKKIIAVSYSDDLALKHSVDTRQLMESQLYKTTFPNVILSRRGNTQNMIKTTMGGFRMAVSMGGSITGHGADLIIIDDPIKPDDAASDVKRKTVNDAYDSTIYSRLNDRTHGAIVVVMQRVHEDDLVGHIMEQEPWEVLNLPAIAIEHEKFVLYDMKGNPKIITRQPGDALHPEYQSAEQLKIVENVLGAMRFSAQYQQSPTPLEGGLIKLAWLQYYSALPNEFPSQVIHSWDTASKAGLGNDYSVCTVWHVYDNHYYIVDVFRERLEYPQLRQKIIEMAQASTVHAVLIEDQASGIQLIQDIKDTTNIPVVARQPESSKFVRMEAQAAKFHSGLVYLPEKAPWLADFMNELLKFPNSKYDDRVDSVSQALKYLTERRIEPRLRIL